MKKILIAAIMLACVAVFAEQRFDVAKFTITSVHTNTTYAAYTNANLWNGVVRQIIVLPGSNMICRVRTLSGTGASLFSRTILETNAITAAAGYDSYLTTPIYLYGEKLILEANQSTATNYATGVEANIIIETK